MLSTEKIHNAFLAICEEVEKLENKNLDTETHEALRRIRSIAKHQSDIRKSPAGSCRSNSHPDS